MWFFSWFSFHRHYFTRIPLRVVHMSYLNGRFSVRSRQRLQHDTEECCVTLFAQCIFRQEKPFNLLPFCGPDYESVPALLQHAPELMALPTFDNNLYRHQSRPELSTRLSLAATLIARFACALVHKRADLLDEATVCHESLSLILDLPTLSGDTFDLELDTACRDISFNQDELRRMLDVLAPFKRQADVWRVRAQWITACIQIGFCTSDGDADRYVKKLCV